MSALLTGCAAARRPVHEPAADSGNAAFQSYCAACHQYDGQAVGEAPPLDDSPWVTGPESTLIKIVLHGISGRIELRGKTYDREMPGFGQILSDADVASLLTYVRGRFGGPNEPITPEAVRKVRGANADRTAYWTVDELATQPLALGTAPVLTFTLS
jgi:mono/diheme cytochrome c family protein